MKRYITVLLLALGLAFGYKTGHASDFTNERLNYKVMYKLGLVNKQAGSATLAMTVKGSEYHMVLTAASAPWADNFFMVRDTLTGVVDRATFRPKIYQKCSHEGGDHKHDVVKYVYSGDVVVGTCTRKKWDKKYNLKIDEQRTLTARGVTIDMLSSFYYMRNRPYQNWKQGQTVKVNLFSGKRREILTITYLGQEKVQVDNKTYNTYHISFTFTDPLKPKNATSDPMDAWISTDAARIPIKLEGKLPVGKVQCFYTGGR